MTTKTDNPFQSREVPIQSKLAAAWTSFMFLYVYVDLLGLYKPGMVDDILNGKVFTFEITETFAASALAATVLPTLMILLSATLPARANRVTNLVVATVLIPYMAFNLAGGEWLFYYARVHSALCLDVAPHPAGIDGRGRAGRDTGGSTLNR